MASLPPRQTPRRPSPSQRAEAADAAPAVRRESSFVPSISSEDSQTVLVNDPNTHSRKEVDKFHDTPDATTTESTKQPPEDEPRKCWICFSDETEDTPQTSAWKRPCPCALTAHEQCLLDWIADMEKPVGGRNTSSRKDIKCPQCRSKIHLARPRSLVVETVNSVEKFLGRAMWPGILAGMGYTLVIGASHHGAHTIRMIFGPDDARTILAPRETPGPIQQYFQQLSPQLSEILFHDWRGARLELGLPLIPLTLIASRTTMADAILPILPILFFATHPEHSHALTNHYWPPSAALTLVVLPYVRGIYDDYMERIWGERERGWLREIRPRLGGDDQQTTNTTEGNRAGQANAADNDHDDEIVVEVEIGNILGGDEDEEGERHEQAPALDAPPMDENEAAREVEELAAQIELAANNAARREAQQQQEQEAERRQRRRQIRGDRMDPLGRTVESIFGALLFPSVAAGSGELLRLLLPASLTVPKLVGGSGGRRVPTGLLQTRWGRSIVGGCLFVVLKDALRIYCRWRMAQAFRIRKVLDWDKAAGRTVDPSS